MPFPDRVEKHKKQGFDIKKKSMAIIICTNASRGGTKKRKNSESDWGLCWESHT